MKATLTAQQLVYFRQNGKILFEDFPLDITQVTPAEQRDLWRQHPPLLKFILRKLGPIALELTGKSSLRLLCDQWFDTIPSAKRLQDLFCFQGIAVVCVLKDNKVSIYEPSSLVSLLEPDSLLVAFGTNKAQFIHNPQDRYLSGMKKWGYGYGDAISSKFHPLIFPSNLSH